MYSDIIKANYTGELWTEITHVRSGIVITSDALVHNGLENLFGKTS
jgi:hypothetical protein